MDEKLIGLTIVIDFKDPPILIQVVKINSDFFWCAGIGKQPEKT